jgi:hypothetical protein
MTQLLVGYHSVFEIASRPDVAIREADTALLDAFFPKVWPYVHVKGPWSRPEGLGELSAPPCSCII